MFCSRASHMAPAASDDQTRFTQAPRGQGGIYIWICTLSSYPDFKLSDLPKGAGEGFSSGFVLYPHITLISN